MPGQSPFLDAFFNVILSRDGTKIANTTRIDYSTAFTLTLRTDGTVAIDTNASVVDGEAIAPSSIAVSGPISQSGGMIENTITSITTGPMSAQLLLSLPLNDNSIMRGCIDVIGFAQGVPDYVSWGTDGGTGTLGVMNGSFGALGGTIAFQQMSFGLPLTMAVAWAAGIVTIKATGLSATITGAADNGGGKVRVTCAAGGLSANLTTHGTVNISGVVGTTEANGTNLAATYVSPTTFDLLNVSFSNSYVSGGTVVLYAPPVVAWTSSYRMSYAPHT